MDGLGICLLILIVVSFVLFVIRIVFIFYHNILLARELKRITRELSARRCNTANTTCETSNQTGNQPPKDDVPPAYDEVMHGNLYAKSSLQAAEEGQTMQNMGSNLSNAQSTITIETTIDANGSSSTNDLRNQTTSSSNTTNSAETNNTTEESSNNSIPPPPSYERCISQYHISGPNGDENKNIT